MEACCKGRMEDVLRDPSNRRRLTLHCQCCDKRYTRAADLSFHLQASHSQIWMSAQPLALQLVQSYYGLKGCIYNPSCTVARLQHVCLPYWQLAMQFERTPMAILMPQPLTLMDLARILPEHVPAELRPALEQAFMRYNLSELWDNALLLDALSGICFFCGLEGHPAELCYHLHEAHGGLATLVQMYVQQLVPHAQAHSDLTGACFACGMLVHLPSNESELDLRLTHGRLVQVHLRRQCPSLLQLAQLLVLTHHGQSRLADGAVRYGSAADDSHVPGVGLIAGSELETVGQPRGTKKATSSAPASRHKRRRLQAKAAAGHVQGHDADGQNDAENGPGHADASQGDDVSVLLLLQGAKRGSAPTGEGSHSLARTGPDGVVIIDDTTSADPDAKADAGTDHPNREADGGTGQLATASSGTEEPDHPGRPHGPLHAVGPPDTGFEGQHQDPSVPGQTGTELRGAIGSPEGSHPGDEISLSSHKGGEPGDPLATTAVGSGRSSIPHTTTPVSESGVGPGGGQHEAAQPASEQPCHGPGTQLGHDANQGQGQVQNQEQSATAVQARADGEVMLSQAEMVQTVKQMTLCNPGNWCFGNASVYCLLWTILSLANFEVGFFGTQCDDLKRFLRRAGNCIGNLSDEAFFRSVMSSWGRDAVGQLTYSISQQDAAEFIHTWLSVMQTPVFRMAWEKRLLANSNVAVLDRNHEAFTPITLQFDDVSLGLSTFSLNLLVTTWCQADGMCTALLEPSWCVCLHIDRCFLSAEMEVQKCMSAMQLDGDTFLPVFADVGMIHVHHAYSIVAVMSHLGSDGQGQYRSALRVRTTVLEGARPVNWLVTDDWLPPQAVWQPATWLQENSTVIWLVRSDLLRLPPATGGINPADAEMSTFMHLLAQ